jgi:hypothetical protein
LLLSDIGNERFKNPAKPVLGYRTRNSKTAKIAFSPAIRLAS